MLSPRLTNLSLLTGFCLASVVAGVGPSTAPSVSNEIVTFDHIPSPNSGITNCIIRGERGFLWFGTTKGLCKYDGYQVRHLSVGTELPLSGTVAGHDRQAIFAIATMGDGTLLLGTDLGLWKFDALRETFTSFLGTNDLFKTR